MRVALDATSLLDAHPTGVGAFTAAVLDHLARDHPEDIDARAFAISWRGRDRLRTMLPAGITAATRPMAARPLRAAWRRVGAPPIEWWTGAVDVVHGTNFVVPPTRTAAAIVTIHDLTCLRFPELCSPAVLQYPALIEQAIRRGAYVHTVSHAVADEVRDAFTIDPDRVVAIPNGGPAAVTGDASAGRRLAGAERYILFLGTIEPRKDLPLLVRAFDAVATERDDVRLVIAGPDGWGVDALAEARRGATHDDRIVRLGWVTDQQRNDLLHGATLLAYPSRYEGFGLPPLEAMAAGVPVVASDAGALAETIGDAGVLVPTGDGDALAAALGELVDDDGARATLVVRGTANLERFSWRTTVDTLVDLYRRAAGRQ